MTRKIITECRTTQEKMASKSEKYDTQNPILIDQLSHRVRSVVLQEWRFQSPDGFCLETFARMFLRLVEYEDRIW